MASPLPQLVNLNDDCLEHIFSFLDLSDQLMVKAVCTRFEEIVRSVWRRNKAIIIPEQLYLDLQRRNEQQELFEFLRYNSNNAVSICLGSIDYDLYEVLSSMTFPKVKKVHVTISKFYPGLDNTSLLNKTTNTNMETLFAKISTGEHFEDITQQLHITFPNVEDLTYCCDMITGKNLPLFKNVQSLGIENCASIEPKHFKCMLSTLKIRRLSIFNIISLINITNINIIGNFKLHCSNLEKLSCGMNDLFCLLGVLKEIPKLREITVVARKISSVFVEAIIESLIEVFASRMRSFSYYQPTFFVPSVLKLKNVERLTLHCTTINSEFIAQIGKELKNLREFRIATEIVRIDDGIMSLVENCSKLEILDITNCNVNQNFLDRLNLFMKEQKSRITPLKLYCYDNAAAWIFSKGILCLCEQLRVIVKEHKWDKTAHINVIIEPLTETDN